MAIPPATTDRLSNPRWLRLVHLNAGLSAAELAAALRCDAADVNAALEEHHVARRSPGALNGVGIAEPRETDWMVNRLVTRTGTVTAVARELGCGETTVRTATHREPVAAALAAAGWDPAANAASAKGGRPAADPMPADNDLLAAIGDTGATIAMLVQRFALNATQERRLHDRLADLVDVGALTVTGTRPKWFDATGVSASGLDPNRPRRAPKPVSPERAALNRALYEPALPV